MADDPKSESVWIYLIKSAVSLIKFILKLETSNLVGNINCIGVVGFITISLIMAYNKQMDTGILQLILYFVGIFIASAVFSAIFNELVIKPRIFKTK